MRWRRQLFYLISRSAIALYRTFPVFGRLRGGIAIIRHGDRFVVIERSDGLGFSFPGGMCAFREHPAATTRREVMEETGLDLPNLQYRFTYSEDSLFPAETHVFDADLPAEQPLQLRSSWEGEAREVTFAELRQNIVISHRRALESLEMSPH